MQNLSGMDRYTQEERDTPLFFYFGKYRNFFFKSGNFGLRHSLRMFCVVTTMLDRKRKRIATILDMSIPVKATLRLGESLRINIVYF